MKTEDKIYKEICDLAGIEQSRIDGHYVFVSVKEMRSHQSSWRSTPMGRFQINVRVPGERRDRIFRTKNDGSYDRLAVNDAIKLCVRKQIQEKEMWARKEQNKEAAQTIRDTYKLKTTYVSSYAGSAGSYVAPATVEGKLNVQINFGAVDPAVAEKIMAFAQSLEA